MQIMTTWKRVDKGVQLGRETQKFKTLGKR